MASVAGGVAALRDAFALLRRERSLWPLALAPAALAALAVTAATLLVWSYAGAIDALVAGWVPAIEAGAWYTWIWVGPLRLLFGLLHWLLFLLAAALAIVLAFMLANVAAAPFLEMLSRRVEMLVTGSAPEAGGGFWREARRAIVNELRRLTFFSAVWIALAALSLVPAVNLLTPIAFAVFTMLFLPIEYGGSALDRRAVPFDARRRWVAANLPLMLGFGAGAFLTLLVPGLNFVMLPVLVVAGTLLVTRHHPG